jgi:hypothetical protein
MKVIITLSICLLLSGCSVWHGGTMTSSASLSTNNFAYVKWNVEGAATATYVFGIGGFNHQALVSEAKYELMQAYPLQSNQAYVNLTVNWRRKYLVFVIKEKCTVSASIVQFNPKE